MAGTLKKHGLATTSEKIDGRRIYRIAPARARGMSLQDELAALEHASLEDLRLEWGRRYGAPPPLRSAMLLRQILAWRVQAELEGGFDASMRRLLPGDGIRRETLLSTGTVIAREWKGIRHEVEVAEDGYIHQGRRWNSLSEVAHHHRHPLERPALFRAEGRGMKKQRCAIYARKSSEEGLDQAFNSLDAQREACVAYVASQKSEGWSARRPSTMMVAGRAARSNGRRSSASLPTSLPGWSISWSSTRLID